MSPIDTTHLLAPTPRPDVVMTRGEGSWLYDETGNRYLDFVQGWAVNCLGHSSDVIRKSLVHQADQLLNPSPAYYNRPQLDLAALLCEKSGLDRVFFCNSGAEANEGAIKLARKWGKQNRGGATEIITFTGAFHGRTLATMAATDKPDWDTLFAPGVEGFCRVEFGNLAAVKAAIGSQTVGIMLEPVQGEAGVVEPPEGFLASLRRLCDEHGLLLIFDEIQTGMSRTGPLFAYQSSTIAPDIMTLGKGLGGGVPIAAVLASEKASCFEPGDQGGTFNGNPLMCAVGLAVLHTLCDADFAHAASQASDHLRSTLENTAQKYSASVRGQGHLLAMVLPKPVASEVAARCFEAGLLINTPRPDVLRFMPSLTTSPSEIDDMIAILSPILDEALQ